MDRLVNPVDGSSSSELDGSAGNMSEKQVGSKLSFKSFYEKPAEGNLASSSSVPLKSYFVGMGFSPNLVEKVIEENGEQDANFLLETLFTYSALQKTPDESPDSLEGLATPKAENSSSFEFSSASNQEIEEVDVSSQPNTDKRQSLLMMNFSAEEVDLAMSRLGEDAHVTELVDFIVAAQTSGDSGEKEKDDSSLGCDAKPKIITTDTSFGAMDKTHCLLEMGFSNDDISAAIEKFGSDIPTPELADAILSTQVPEDETTEDTALELKMKMLQGVSNYSAFTGMTHDCYAMDHVCAGCQILLMILAYESNMQTANAFVICSERRILIEYYLYPFLVLVDGYHIIIHSLM